MVPNFNQQQPQIFTMLVKGEDLPNTYPVGLGSTGLFIDFSSGKFWVRENPSGVPRPLRTFEFRETTPQPELQNGSGNFVSREEFVSLNEKLDRLINELGGAK